MKVCPPKPGLTVITRIWSSLSSTYSSAVSGVDGVRLTPALLAELLMI